MGLRHIRNAVECRDARDALSRAIYTGLFDMIIGVLNQHMASLATEALSDENELFVGKAGRGQYVKRKTRF